MSENQKSKDLERIESELQSVQLKIENLWPNYMDEPGDLDTIEKLQNHRIELQKERNQLTGRNDPCW